MTEIGDVLTAIERLRERGEAMALATVVGVRGSTYRGPGARLLVTGDGEMVGNISAGCLEGEMADVARRVMADGAPRLVTYDLTADDEAVWGWGLGCNGVIDVFVEPAAPAAAVAPTLSRALEEERPLALVTVIRSTEDGVTPGARLLVAPDGDTEGGLGDTGVDEAALGAARESLAGGASRTGPLRAPHDGVEVFVEVLEPPPRLLVLGAGHDAIPLVRSASALGWRVEVADDRPAMLTIERFPGAARLIALERPEDAAGTAGLDARTHAVVMSHNYLRDRAYLATLLGTDVAYIGVLGPRNRLQRLLADLARDGIRPTEADRAKLHGPAGLDLGAEGADEIAWAIVAEILAVRRGRPAGFLRDRSGPIHDR